VEGVVVFSSSLTKYRSQPWISSSRFPGREDREIPVGEGGGKRDSTELHKWERESLVLKTP